MRGRLAKEPANFRVKQNLTGGDIEGPHGRHWMAFGAPRQPEKETERRVCRALGSPLVEGVRLPPSRDAFLASASRGHSHITHSFSKKAARQACSVASLGACKGQYSHWDTIHADAVRHA